MVVGGKRGGKREKKYFYRQSCHTFNERFTIPQEEIPGQAVLLLHLLLDESPGVGLEGAKPQGVESPEVRDRLRTGELGADGYPSWSALPAGCRLAPICSATATSTAGTEGGWSGGEHGRRRPGGAGKERQWQRPPLG